MHRKYEIQNLCGRFIVFNLWCKSIKIIYIGHKTSRFEGFFNSTFFRWTVTGPENEWRKIHRTASTSLWIRKQPPVKDRQKLDTIKIPKFSPSSKFGKFPLLVNEFQDQQTVFLNSLSSCLAGFRLTVCLFQKQWTLVSDSFDMVGVSYEWLTSILCIMTMPRLYIAVSSGLKISFRLQHLGMVKILQNLNLQWL